MSAPIDTSTLDSEQSFRVTEDLMSALMNSGDSPEQVVQLLGLSAKDLQAHLEDPDFDDKERRYLQQLLYSALSSEISATLGLVVFFDPEMTGTEVSRLANHCKQELGRNVFSLAGPVLLDGELPRPVGEMTAVDCLLFGFVGHIGQWLQDFGRRLEADGRVLKVSTVVADPNAGTVTSDADTRAFCGPDLFADIANGMNRLRLPVRE